MSVALPTGDVIDTPLWFTASGEQALLTVLNAGIIDVADGDALNLQGANVTYNGTATAYLKRVAGIALSATAFTGDTHLTINHDIDAHTAISAVGGVFDGEQSIRVDVQSGTIHATQTGLQIANLSDGEVRINIGKDAKLIGPQALFATGNAVFVTLAGEIAAETEGGPQASILGEHDDTLELHPHYKLTGSINADGGTDTLVLGGAGEGVFQLPDFGHAFLDFETAEKAGSSSWRLEGVATRRFDLAIQSGAVTIAGSVTPNSIFTVGAEAMLTGGGRLGLTDVHGTLAPGERGVGTLYAGDVTFYPGSFFDIDVSGDTADLLQADSVKINGAGLRVFPTAGSVGTYEILSTTQPLGPSDRFSLPDGWISPRYLATIDYSEVDVPGLVTLTLSRAPVTFSGYAQTPEQATVAALLDAMGANAPYYDQLHDLEPADVAALLEQLAGSDLTAIGGVLLQNASSLSAASLGRIQQQSGAIGQAAPILGYSAFSQDGPAGGLSPSVWGRLLAGTSTLGGSVAGSTAMIGGADVELGDDWTFGLLAGIGHSSITGGTTTTRSTDLSAGLYGAKEFGMLALRFGASLTHHAVDSSRLVTAPGVSETYKASYGALTAQTFAEVASTFEMGPVSLELFGDLGYARHFSPRFIETGGPGALTVASSSADAVDTTMGIRATHKTAIATRLLATGLMLGWKHRFAAIPSTSNSLAGGTPFDVAGSSTAGSAIVFGTDLRFDLDERTGLEASYALEWGAHGLAQSISARYARLL